MELYGTLWNFLMCLMEQNNYGGNAINTVVTLRLARLILGWVTVCGQVNHISR